MSETPFQYHPDLMKYANMRIPVVPKIVPIMQKLMGVLYHQERSDPEVAVSRLKIPARDGFQLRALLYTPAAAQADGPCLLFFHGGGFVYNAAPHHFGLARSLAKALGWKTLLVDYRLAPKYKYPTPVEDALDTYRFLLDNAPSLGIDPARIALCGDSAGGNLAAVVCLMARDQSLPLPRAQMLLYPVTDRRLTTASMARYTDTPMCNSPDIVKYYSLYLDQGEPENIPYLSPMEAPSLSGLPRAYVEAAEYDCLHDEGIAYGAAMQAAGVEVEIHEVKGAMHGYDIAAGTPYITSLLNQRTAFLKRAMEDGIASPAIPNL